MDILGTEKAPTSEWWGIKCKKIRQESRIWKAAAELEPATANQKIR